jgi:hypothetical protein
MQGHAMLCQQNNMLVAKPLLLTCMTTVFEPVALQGCNSTEEEMVMLKACRLAASCIQLPRQLEHLIGRSTVANSRPASMREL